MGGKNFHFASKYFLNKRIFSSKYLYFYKEIVEQAKLSLCVLPFCDDAIVFDT